MPVSYQVWLGLALALVGTAYVLRMAYVSDAARIRRALRNTGKSEVESAPEGQVIKLIGTLSCAGEPLRAPLSERPCSAYEVLVRTEGKSAHRVVRDAAHADFWLNDGTGTALVRMKDAKVSIHQDTHRRSGTFNKATPELEAFLRKHGKTSIDTAFGASFNRPLRYEEGVLAAGETVAVVGYATREADVSPGAAPGDSRFGRAKRLVLQSNGDAMPLYVSDKPDVLH